MLSVEDDVLLTRTDPGTPMGELFRRFWRPIRKPGWVMQPDAYQVRAGAIAAALCFDAVVTDVS